MTVWKSVESFDRPDLSLVDLWVAPVGAAPFRATDAWREDGAWFHSPCGDPVTLNPACVLAWSEIVLPAEA